MDKLELLRNERDVLIRRLWVVLNDMSYLIPADGYDGGDLELWGIVTKHPAVQNRLTRALKEPERKEADAE